MGRILKEPTKIISMRVPERFADEIKQIVKDRVQVLKSINYRKVHFRVNVSEKVKQLWEDFFTINYVTNGKPPDEDYNHVVQIIRRSPKNGFIQCYSKMERDSFIASALDIAGNTEGDLHRSPLRLAALMALDRFNETDLD